MLLGALLIIGAIVLTYWNQREDNAAQEAAVQIVPQLVQQIQDNTVAEDVDPDIEVIPDLRPPVELLTEEDKKMPEVKIDNTPYIGYLSIPALHLQLPVIGNWSYPRLKIAPCRYTGSVRGEDLVLMAHNFRSHFGRISRLKIGDKVFFTGMDGKTTTYEVVGEDVLDPTAVEAITSGEYDLTLFTCTYGGASRVTVYCDIVK